MKIKVIPPYPNLENYNLEQRQIFSIVFQTHPAPPDDVANVDVVLLDGAVIINMLPPGAALTLTHSGIIWQTPMMVLHSFLFSMQLSISPVV